MEFQIRRENWKNFCNLIRDSSLPYFDRDFKSRSLIGEIAHPLYLFAYCEHIFNGDKINSITVEFPHYRDYPVRENELIKIVKEERILLEKDGKIIGRIFAHQKKINYKEKTVKMYKEERTISKENIIKFFNLIEISENEIEPYIYSEKFELKDYIKKKKKVANGKFKPYTYLPCLASGIITDYLRKEDAMGIPVFMSINFIKPYELGKIEIMLNEKQLAFEEKEFKINWRQNKEIIAYGEAFISIL
ncbi:MAG: hypothetical protein ACOYT4_05370 [Nanoarchaeota archaeon]